MNQQPPHLTAPGDSYDRRRRWLGPRDYWLCQCGGWGGLLVLMIAPLPFRMRISAAEVIALVAFSATGLLLTHLLRLGLIKVLQTPAPWLRMLVPTALLTVACALPHASLQVLIARTILPHDAVFLTAHPAYDPLLFTLLDTYTLSVAVFIFWTGAYIGLRVYRRYQEARIERIQLEADMQEAAWQALRAQLNPHLLFNSLNSIRALISRDNPAPRQAILHLSELLRTTLALKDEHLIPLARELETVHSFLALERLRFEERLRVRQTLCPEAAGWLVPPLVLQTLVENAVKFGVSPYEGGGTVDIDIRVVDGRLVIAVSNTGQLGMVRVSQSTGLGLENLRSRLRLLFGPAAQLTLENSDPEHVRAKVVVPRETIARGQANSPLP